MLAPDGAERVESGTFAIAEDGARWVFSGGLTIDDATRILEESRSLPLPRSGHVDLSGLQSADSSALAVLMALKRRASAERHHKLVFEGLPEAIMALAHVYGIDELIDTAHPAP